MKLDPTKKRIAEKEVSTLRPGLYLTATPVGNMGDITLRALEILRACNLVACEDTRQTGKLLHAYGIEKPMAVYNDHATAKQREALIRRIQDGQALALVSDAGTPLVSDPGFKLVRACREAGLYVTSLPGANAVLTALQLSGLPGDSFSFLGFLPAKDKARADALARWRQASGTLIAYETAPRLVGSLKTIRDVLGERRTSVLRELTKLYEEVRTGFLSELISHYEENGAPKGEIVLVIAPPEEEEGEAADPEVDAALSKALAYLGTRQASSLVAEIFGKPKKDLYDRALKLSADK